MQKRKTRREFLSWLTTGASLILAYGTFGLFSLRFLYPGKKLHSVRDIFVSTLDALEEGKSFKWEHPSGQKVLIHSLHSRYLAFSNVCPHLGCKVHWEANNKRFFCPCHGGAFDADGRPTEGPPKAENKFLKQYELIVKGKALYIRVADI